MRSATVSRKTNETNITIEITLEGQGRHKINTKIGFFDHMLQQIAVHGLFDLNIQATGDLDVDTHHTIEDVALVLGQAILQAIGDRKGITRFSQALVPMDEALCQMVLDLSGRPFHVFRGDWAGSDIGGIPVTLIEHFFQSLSTTLKANLHACILYGRDDHHKAEALFKALAIALKEAVAIDRRRSDVIPSSKGSL